MSKKFNFGSGYGTVDGGPGFKSRHGTFIYAVKLQNYITYSSHNTNNQMEERFFQCNVSVAFAECTIQ